MSEREESPDRQENGSHQSNDDRGRRSHSPRSGSRSGKRHHSRSSAPFSPRERRSPYESSGGGGGYPSRGRPDRGYDMGRYPSDGGSRRGGSSRDRRSHSRSPMSSRRRHQGNRENPPAGRCLGIFGLSIYTQERDLNEVFGKFGPIDDVQIVYDAQTGRSRGFAFVYFKNTDDAQMAKERCNGIDIDGRKIRVDFSITQRAHTPTPGIYMGKPTYRGSERGSERNDYYPGSTGGGGGGGSSVGHGGPSRGDPYFRERSPSPYYSRDTRRRYSRSRSRSYSPRKYTHYY